MIYLLAVPALALVAGLLYLASLPGELAVRRSLFMRVERRLVFDRIRDLPGWKDWSPWLIHEPETRLTYSPDPQAEGGSYSWDGQHIGAGTLTNCRFEPPARIEQRIGFVRPFKSSSRVVWELAERDGGTEVSWSMEGPMPFLFRPLIAQMTPMIEKDYDLGLALLRGVLDPQAERPAIRFVGPVERPETTALVISFAGGLQALIQAMQEGFPRLLGQVRGAGHEPAGPPLAAYGKTDLKALRFECDMALPVTEYCPSGPFAQKRLPGGPHFAVELSGSYAFLPLVWHSAMGHLRMRKLKVDRTRPCLEIYENDPRAVAHSNEIRTRLEIPLRR